MNADHTIALSAIVILFAMPIVTGIHNDRKRSPLRKVNHPVWCAAHLPGGPYADPYPCGEPRTVGSVYCREHRS